MKREISNFAKIPWSLDLHLARTGELSFAVCFFSFGGWLGVWETSIRNWSYSCLLMPGRLIEREEFLTRLTRRNYVAGL